MELGNLLPRQGTRSLADRAVMEACLVHARSLIYFCCGDYGARRDRRDIQPADFLGKDWWPPNDDDDRIVRGRVRFINQKLQHLSWERVLDQEPLLVSVVLLVHEVHWAMTQFINELRTQHNDWFEGFEMQRQALEALLPALNGTAETVPHLAPPRSGPIAS